MGVNTRNMYSCLQKYKKLNKSHLVGQLLKIKKKKNDIHCARRLGLLHHVKCSVLLDVSKDSSASIFRIIDATTAIPASTILISQHDIPGGPIILSILHMEIIPVISENPTEHSGTFCGQNEVVLMWKLVVLMATCVSW
jgi:hypothetical protein